LERHCWHFPPFAARERAGLLMLTGQNESRASRRRAS